MRAIVRIKQSNIFKGTFWTKISCSSQEPAFPPAHFTVFSKCLVLFPDTYISHCKTRMSRAYGR